MCTGGECKLKETCIRFKGEKDKHQYVQNFYNETDIECDFYLPITSDTPLTTKDEYDKFLIYASDLLRLTATKLKTDHITELSDNIWKINRPTINGHKADYVNLIYSDKNTPQQISQIPINDFNDLIKLIKEIKL